MSQRNYNNVTSLGTLSAPAASSATTLSTSGFSGFPSAPFTITVDRNTATEEICLVTGVGGSTLTVVRGYDGTAGQAHSAGATVEHTSVALDYTEANLHVNASAGVHGVTGALVGAAGAQTIYDKTLISPVVQADVTNGDAVVAYVPSAASARNLFRGISPASADVTVITSAGALSTAGITSTGALRANGNTQLDGTLTVTGVTTHTGAVTANGGITGTTGAFSGAVSAASESITGASTASSYTATGLVKGAGLESTQAVQLAQIASPSGTASKDTVYAKTDGGIYAKIGTGSEARLPQYWGSLSGTGYPSTGVLAGDTIYRSDLLALFTYNGTGWMQSTVPTLATNAARDTQYATPANIPGGFRIWHSGLAVMQTWDSTGSVWRFTLSGTTTGVTDTNGVLAVTHGGGQTPISVQFTPKEAGDTVNLRVKFFDQGSSSTTLQARAVRTDTSAYWASSAMAVNWTAQY